MRLSFSAVSTYTSCPRKYKLSYIDKIGPIQKPSPFSIGSSIDGAAEHYLLNKDKTEALQEFENLMRAEHEENDIKYSQSDVQVELLPEDFDMQGFDVELKDFLKYCKENPNKLDEDEYPLLRTIQIEAVVAKGKLMLPEFFKWVDENVETVNSCQRKIEIENELGDTFIGYLDFDVTLKNGKRYIFDLKTSSNPKAYYPDTSASESMQLGIYSSVTDIPLVGYFVIDKSIRKREPRVRSKEVRGEITEEFLDETFDKIEEVRYNITQGRFEKNTESCFEYGRCQYHNLCKNGSMAGLCAKEKE